MGLRERPEKHPGRQLTVGNGAVCGTKRDLFQRAEKEEPGGGAENGHKAGEQEGVNERARVLDEEAGDDGSGDAGEIANEILQAGPAAGSARPGENLRDDPGVGNVEAVHGGGEEKKGDGVVGADDGAGGEGDDGHEEVREGADFPHARERKLALVDEIVRQPGQQEIQKVVAAEMTEESSPGGTVGEDVRDAGRGVGFVFRSGK